MTGWVDELRHREAVFRRAPSAHNTQPWVVRYGADEVAVHWDPARALPDSDPTGRDLFLSLGAFVEACLITATDAGLPLRAEVSVDAARRRVARLLPGSSGYPSRFTAEALERRRCARARYRPGQLDPVTLGEVAEQADLTGTGAELRAVPCRDLAGLLLDADRWMFGTPAVVRELREWLRLSPRHPRYAVDGLSDRALAMSRAEASGLAAVLAPRVYPVARRLGAPALLAAASKGLLRYDGSVLVLVGRAERPEDLVEHGRSLLRVWLSLGERGLAVHPLSQLIDCASTARALRDLLHLGPEEAPLAVFRVGRPVEEPVRSARLPPP
ncbi:hypothetical protein [Luedemannella helvata]|uniref:Nitroreductase family protein n=1 Tax=Luedemannella helvata TaxID=349315 RepID=A0ABP4X5D7_9ACTN